MSAVEKYDSRPETRQHIDRVRYFLAKATTNLRIRGGQHDRSKLEEPELAGWDDGTAQLVSLEYGSPEYKASLKKLRPTIEHHYSVNDHHPEFYGEKGVRGMSLMSLIEMLCDWRAASERTKQTMSFADSLAHNKERFNLSDDLYEIIVNTATELGML